MPIAAGGALALLALGGAAYALMRRRRHDEDVWVDDEVMEHEPVQSEVAAEPVTAAPEPIIHEPEPAMIAPSALAWGNNDHGPETQVAEDDRQPGESWVERAYRGPSAGNPSVSLRARLKRAAFFDKREREVAAGTAAPVDTDAGLPEGMVDEQERELV